MPVAVSAVTLPLETDGPGALQLKHVGAASLSSLRLSLPVRHAGGAGHGGTHDSESSQPARHVRLSYAHVHFDTVFTSSLRYY